VLVTKLREWGVKRAGDDSSGNAGASLAAYCAHARIKTEIFAPARASSAKLSQIEIFGATLWPIAGKREKATEAIEARVRTGKLVYASHAWSPFTYEGAKTVAYEIWEQLGGHAPDCFISPIGQGSLFIGAHRGLKDLLEAGLISTIPRMIGVQSDRCAPVVQAVRQGLETYSRIRKRPSIAEGIALAHPIHSREILKAIRETGGDAVAVSDAETAATQIALARIGFYVEPTSAVVGAAAGKLRLKGLVVAALTGSGLKSATAS
jgi:threonine synthase